VRSGQIETFAGRVQSDRRRAREAALLALLAAAAVVPVSLVSGSLALALVAGAASELVLATLWHSRSVALVRQLALRRHAYCIPEVKAFGSRICAPARRARLAGRLHDIRTTTPRGPLVARIVARRAELDALAEALCSPQLELEPSCAAACLQLLTDARRSPLLNPRLPADDLAVALHHILAGFSDRPPLAGAVEAASLSGETAD
jgi:hypothetical protein